MGGVVSAIFGGGGGGGGSAQPTSTTVNNSNLPPYLQPYVENMLNATQAQIYGTDENGNLNSTFKPYVPYSNNPADYVAGASPMMEQSYSTAANLQTPSQYGTASQMAQGAGLGSLATTMPAGMYGQQGYNAGRVGMQQGLSYGQNATDPNAVASYMNPYLQATLAPALALQNQQFGMQNVQNQSQATQQGAFGGGRSAVMQGLNQQNQDLAQNQLVGNAYNQAYNTANQNMQNAASLGMQGAGMGIQGAQAGLAGIGAQQAGYAGLGTQAANLANIGGQQLGATENIAQLQNTLGSQQQQQQQNIINQAVQNYATAQQYPFMQLGMLSNMIHGLPTQASTTQNYQALPTTAQQLMGAGIGALGAYKAFGS
jgi:hypothetical protein